MPNRDKGSNERRGLASADEETRERVAKKGGEASHGGRGSSSSDKKSGRSTAASTSGSRGGSSGGSSGGRSSSGSSSGGAHYDPDVDRCRDDQGQFTECADDEKGGGRSGTSGNSGKSSGGSRSRD